MWKCLEKAPPTVPMAAANGWGRLAVYDTIRGASIYTLPFSSDTERGLDRGEFSLMGGRCGGRLNTSEDIEFAMVGGGE